MIGCSKSKEKIIKEDTFKQRREKPVLKFNPVLMQKWPLNNWALFYTNDFSSL